MKYSKIAICSLLILMITPIIYGQKKEFNTRKEIGVSGGVTLSTLSTYDQNDQAKIDGSYIQGIHAGFFYKYVGEANIGVILEASYDQLGYKMVDGNSVRLDYISTPILSHFYIGRKPSHIFINLGPELSFLINEEGSSEFGSVERKSVFGLVGGIGYNKTFGKNKIGLEYRYHFTITSNNKTEGTEAERRNVWMGASLTYSFSLK